ncbi:hypothetical protein V3C99_001652, partial [Haemonchus contortus]
RIERSSPGPTVITMQHNVPGPPDLRSLGVINGIADPRSTTKLGTPYSLLHLRVQENSEHRPFHDALNHLALLESKSLRRMSMQEGPQYRKGGPNVFCPLHCPLDFFE